MKATLDPNLEKHPSNAPRSATTFAREYGAMYGAFFNYSLTREMNFKANFLLWLFVELLWFALQLGFNGVLFSHTDSIGSWSQWQVVMLIGTSHMIQQLFQAVFLVNCAYLSHLVHTGGLDFILLLPRSSRFLISFRQVDIGGFVSALSGLVVVLYAAAQLHLHPSFGQVIAYAFFCFAGIIIHYSLMFMMASVSFWSVRANGLVMAYYNLFSISRVPDVVLQKSYKSLFVLAIPMLVVSNVPVKTLIGKLDSPSEILLLLGLAAGCFAASQIVWIAALRIYKSASS